MERLTSDKKISDNIIKSFGIEDDSLEKSGEGSKGGKVIGHTKSGKPVYENKHADHYKDFTREDHTDAKKLHRNEAKEHEFQMKRTEESSHYYKDSDTYKERKRLADHHHKMMVYHELNADPGR